MRLIISAIVTILLIVFSSCKKENERPNILFCISDDQSFPHASAYGCNWVKTPAFDRIAEQGLLFTNAYTCNAKCAPSRAAVLTGRNSWQLEEAASHVGYFPTKFKTVFEALKDAGYHTGRTAKGWAPGIVRKKNGKSRTLIGTNYSSIKTIPPATGIRDIDYAANFEAFLKDQEEGKPFAFWYGGIEPHRAYEYGSGLAKGGKKLSDIDKVPAYWMDNDTVRNDMLDYAFEIEYFDEHLQQMLDALEKKGMLENTLIVVTSDNGMPFPRCKAQEYPFSCHMPLAIMWADGIKRKGRTITDFVSHIDFAATFLDAAGISEEESGMEAITGESLVSIFDSKKDGRVSKDRNYVLVGKERHDTGRPGDVGYPIRGIISDEYIYLKNFNPERWPTGRPETGYLDCDGGPTKTLVLDAHNTNEHQLWARSFGKRSQEEFYDLNEDPDCMDNVAGKLDYKTNKELWSNTLTEQLEIQKDPRMTGNGDVFDKYPIFPKQQGFYEKYMNGQEMNSAWVNKSDFRPEQNLELNSMLSK
jgi:N-sulfoglucosamine sulfohydrolase